MKKILIILIICIIITSIILLIHNKNGPKIDEPHEIEEEFNPILSDESIETLNIRNRYFVVKNIVEKYYKSLCNLNSSNKELILYYDNDYSEEEKNQIMQEEIELNQKNIYSYFDESIISYKNLKSDNLQEKLGIYKNVFVDINNIKYIESINLAVYFVDGQVIEKETKQINNFLLMLVVDSQNSTFNLYTEDYIKEKQLDKFSKESFKLLGYERIESRQYNKYSYQLISDETYFSTMFDNFINRLKYNTDYSYNILQKQYKEKRFQDIESYKDFIEKMSLDGICLDQYKIYKNDNIKEFVFIDNKGKIWIFCENTVMNYNVILDTYTIDLPEFIEKYNSSTNEEKVLLNLQKCFEAINNKDYTYVYNKLDETFKTNNFKTEADFEKYIKANFFDKNKVGAKNPKLHGNVYTYELTISDASGKKTNKVNKTFVMQLNEGTDFVMSFNK